MEQPEVQDSEVTGQPAAPASEPKEAPQTEGDQLEGLLDEEQQTDDEVDDELDGVKVRGKKDLIEKIRAERLMQADYTRKTQEVAEQRKAIESQREEVARQAQMAQQYADELGAAKAIDMRLAQFQQVNWDQLEQSDPVQAMRLQREMRDLQTARGQVVNQIVQKHQASLSQQQASLAKQAEQANEYLQREVKGWSPQRSEELLNYGLKAGFPQEALSTFTRQVPAFGVALHKAELYDRLVEKARANKPKPEAQEAPVTRINAPRASANRDPDKMSTGDWLKWREAQVKRNK